MTRDCHAPLVLLVGVFGLSANLRAGPPDFTLTSGDKTFKLADARGRHVALHFLLKTECPYCQRHVAEYARRAPELAGVTHVFLKPDTAEALAAWTAKLREAGIDATIYRDADARLADAFEIPDGYSFHGQTMRYPALVLLGPDGAELFRHVGRDNSDRLAWAPFAAKVAELSRNPAVAQYNLPKSGPAIDGHDPVAYIKDGKSQAGKPELTSHYRGVAYRFASEENRRKFADEPAKHLPAYGGWCATAMADGRKVEIDPDSFQVTDGRLFLFYKGWRGDAKKDWNKDEKGLTARADANWTRIAQRDE